jgi:hypothetical protein
MLNARAESRGLKGTMNALFLKETVLGHDARRSQAERSQLHPELVAVNQLVLRGEQQQHDRRVPLERKPGPLPQAVDREAEISRKFTEDPFSDLARLCDSAD